MGRLRPRKELFKETSCTDGSRGLQLGNLPLQPHNQAFWRPEQRLEIEAFIQDINNCCTCWPHSPLRRRHYWLPSSALWWSPLLASDAPTPTITVRCLLRMPGMDTYRNMYQFVHSPLNTMYSFGVIPLPWMIFRQQNQGIWLTSGQSSSRYLGRSKDRSLLLGDRNSQTERWRDKNSGFDYQLMGSMGSTQTGSILSF